MVRLVTLGTTDLRDAAGDPIGSVLRQPRRFALLVFLALESRLGVVRRDRVLSVFWPEVSQDHGRRSLSQALHYLRRSLGPAAVVSRGAEDLLLDPAAVSCDACAFLDRLEADDPEAALRLFTGDLLPGFFGGVPDFDDWLDQTRAALRRAASEAGWAAAAAAAEAGEWVAAGAVARRAAELNGGDEAAARRLMSFLAGIGDRAGALQAYDALVSQLRREYDAEPAAATAALAAEIRELALAPSLPAGQRLAAIGTMAPAAAAANGSATVAMAGVTESVEPPAAAAGWRAAIARYGSRARSVLVTALLTGGFISLWGLTRGKAEPAPLLSEASLLVEDASGAAPLAQPLTGAVVRLLSHAEGIEVLLPSATAPARADALFLLRTSLLADGDSLQATAGLSDRTTGAALGSARVAVAGTDGDAIEQLAARIAAFARRTAGTELERRRAELSRVAPAARTAWLRAHRDLADADSLHDAGLLDAARVRLEKADSLLASAERTGAEWVEVPLERAELELVRMWVRLGADGDWTNARAALSNGIAHADRAIALAPSDSRGLELRGVLRTMLWLSTPLDSVHAADALPSAAHRDLDQATRLSADAARAWQYLSALLFTRGDYAGAYYAADRALSADAFLENPVGVRTQLFWSALEVGDTAAARRGCDELGRDNPGGWHSSYCRLVLLAWNGSADAEDERTIEALVSTALRDPYAESAKGALNAVHGVLSAQQGNEKTARALLARVLDRSSAQPELMYHAAWIHVALGEADQARALLDRYTSAWPAARNGILRSRRFAEIVR